MLSASGNTVTLTGVETLTGSAGSDLITLSAGVTGFVGDLGGGTDSLTLAAAGGTVTLANVETVTGGAGV
ncbi:hypothetical protein J8J27_35070, partial [Mycobacterium tuberculosis]|nr:hypothetical protein [Mycobacterium tuberculosis]